MRKKISDLVKGKASYIVKNMYPIDLPNWEISSRGNFLQDDRVTLCKSELDNVEFRLRDLVSHTEILLPSELDTICDLLEKARKRAKNGIIGESNIIHNERGDTIDDIIK